MTRTLTQLDPKLTWDDEGCLTDCAVTALADGEQDLVPGATEHIETCERCSAKLGEAALFALELARVVDALPSSALTASAGGALRPLPWRALGCAFVIAVLSITPGLEGFIAQMSSLPTSHGQAFALLARAITRVSAVATWLSGQRGLELAATLLFAACGVLVARFAPRPLPSRGAA